MADNNKNNEIKNQQDEASQEENRNQNPSNTQDKKALKEQKKLEKEALKKAKKEEKLQKKQEKNNDKTKPSKKDNLENSKENNEKKVIGKQKISFGTKNFYLTLIAANAVFVLLLIFQTYSFFSIYSNKADEAFKSGQIIRINAKNNEVEIAEYSNLEKQNEEDLNEVAEIEEPNKIEEESKKEEEVAQETKNIETPEEPQQPAKQEYVKDYESAKLSIIVTNLGLRNDSIERAKTLPTEVSFAFSPYSYELQNKIDEATKAGRESLLNLMLEPANYPMEDTGTLTIQSHFENTQNIFRLQSTAKKANGYIGFLTNVDEVVTHNLESVSPVLKSIKDMDKFFAFYRLPANSSLEREAKPMALDIVAINLLLDDNLSEKEILDKLTAAEDEILLNDKKVVVAIRPYEISINTLKKWLDDNLNAGFQIAPISYFITDN